MQGSLPALLPSAAAMHIATAKQRRAMPAFLVAMFAVKSCEGCSGVLQSHQRMLQSDRSAYRWDTDTAD